MNSQSFNWTLVQSFLAVLEHGSLLGAARACGLKQPTLGRHITELETQLNVVLFERTGRGLHPTAQALQLSEAAYSMQDGAARISRLAVSAANAVEGTVRISASQTIAYYLIPPILARFRLAQPAVTVELVVDNSLSNLLAREADIALRMVRPVQSSLIAKKIADIPVRVCASTDYLRRRGTPKLPADLLVHDLITGDQNREIIAGFEALGFPANALSFGLRTDDLNAQWSAVRAGLGIGFLSSYLIQTDQAVAALLPMVELPVLPIWLTAHRELQSSALIRTVYDLLAREIPADLSA